MAIDQHERQALEEVWKRLEPGRRDESRIGELPDGLFHLDGYPLRFIGVSPPMGQNARERIRIGVFVPVIRGDEGSTSALPEHVDAAVLVRRLTSEEREQTRLPATNQRVAELLGNPRSDGRTLALERLGPKEIFGII